MSITLKTNLDGSMQRAGGALLDGSGPHVYLDADAGAPAFSAVESYDVGDAVSYGHSVYRCILATDDSDSSDASDTDGYVTPDLDVVHWQKSNIVTATEKQWQDAKAMLADIQDDVTDIKANVATLVARQCEIVVTCVTQDDVTVTGQTVTLRAGSSAQAEVYDTRAYNGQPVTFQVPKDFRYFVEVSSTLSGYFNPTTATGTATANTTNVTLTYSDTSHITTYADVKGAMDVIQSQAEGRAALVGIEIADTWTDTDGITVYSDPMIIVDVQPVKDAYGTEHLAALLMRKYATKYNIQFDGAESQAEGYATEATAIAGRYYWGYGATYSQKTYAVNAYCGYNGGIFQCTTAVSAAEAFDPAKWSLKDAVYYSAEKTYAVGDYAKYSGKIYQCATAVETAEAFDEAKWTYIQNGSYQPNALANVAYNAGATINYSAYAAFYHTDVSSSNKDYFQYGYNNWEYSAIRQYLNSAGGIGEWWNPAHVGDCPPSQRNTVKGYKAGCSAALLEYAKPVQVPVYPWNKTGEYTVDQFWLPSGTQMFGEVNDNEGYALKKVQDNCYAASGWTTANNNNTGARVYRRVSATGTSVDMWLRSANRSGSGGVWFVYTSGNISGYNASGSCAGLPACAIY